jgi:hypothetical protein
MASVESDVSPREHEKSCLPSRSDILELRDQQHPTRGGKAVDTVTCFAVDAVTCFAVDTVTCFAVDTVTCFAVDTVTCFAVDAVTGYAPSEEPKEAIARQRPRWKDGFHDLVESLCANQSRRDGLAFSRSTLSESLVDISQLLERSHEPEAVRRRNYSDSRCLFLRDSS